MGKWLSMLAMLAAAVGFLLVLYVWMFGPIVFESAAAVVVALVTVSTAGRLGGRWARWAAVAAWAASFVGQVIVGRPASPGLFAVAGAVVALAGPWCFAFARARGKAWLAPAALVLAATWAGYGFILWDEFRWHPVLSSVREPDWLKEDPRLKLTGQVLVVERWKNRSAWAEGWFGVGSWPRRVFPSVGPAAAARLAASPAEAERIVVLTYARRAVVSYTKGGMQSGHGFRWECTVQLVDWKNRTRRNIVIVPGTEPPAKATGDRYGELPTDLAVGHAVAGLLLGDKPEKRGRQP